MKAVILAGGHGKRLKPLTDNLPKPMIELAGKPIIDWQIEWLKDFGIRSFVMLVGYKKERIIEHVDGIKKDLGIEVEYSAESKPLGTGGALLLARPYLGEDDFLMVNGDVITNIDLMQMRTDACVAAMALVHLKSPFGIVKMSGSSIIDFEEKPILKEHMINAGVYLMKKGIFQYLPKEGDIEKTAFVELARARMLGGIRFDDVYWKSIDSMKDIDEASDDLRQGKVCFKH